MKLFVSLCYFLIIPALSWAQTTQYVSAGTRSLDTNGSEPQRALTLAERHVTPLFGQQRKSSAQIEEEIKFLSDCDRNFASRDEASAFFAARAWEYLQEGQADTATYRFNLAYLLNEKNVDCFWGLGVICYQKNEMELAGQMLRRGVEIAPDNVPLVVDLATVELRNYTKSRAAQDLEESYRLLQHAAALDSTYAQTFFNLAQAEYYRSDYPKAWDAYHQGRKLNFALVDFEFVGLLKAKLPDPVGFFK